MPFTRKRLAVTSLQVASEKKMGIPMIPNTAMNFRAIRLIAASRHNNHY